MPEHAERDSILQDARAMVFSMVCDLATPEQWAKWLRAPLDQGAGTANVDLVCDRATPKQWAEWLRVPLEHAARTANSDMVDKLLKAGADGNAGWKGCNDQTLLHAGAEGGSERVMSALMRAGGKEDMDTKSQSKKRTPLHLAALGGHMAAAKVLITAGADVNISDADNEVPLHLAIRRGHPRVAEYLLLRGADFNVRGWDGWFPIHLAAHRGHNRVVRSLLHRGAHVDHFSDDGWTPLCCAVQENHLSTVKVLLSQGANTATLCKGHTALHKAVQRNNTGIVAALVDAGADIEARDDSVQTPLHKSAFFGSCAAMLALLRLGADVHAKTPAVGSSPLHFACTQGKLDAADLLLRWGADETALDRYGRTPSARIPNIYKVSKKNRPRLERLSKLLADKAWCRQAWCRRRMLVLCRAHLDRLRLEEEVPDTAEASGQPQVRASRHALRSQVKVEVAMGDAQYGAGSAAGGGRRGARKGSGGGGGGFDDMAAWLMATTNDNVFRKIVGFL